MKNKTRGSLLRIYGNLNSSPLLRDLLASNFQLLGLTHGIVQEPVLATLIGSQIIFNTVLVDIECRCSTYFRDFRWRTIVSFGNFSSKILQFLDDFSQVMYVQIMLYYILIKRGVLYRLIRQFKLLLVPTTQICYCSIVLLNVAQHGSALLSILTQFLFSGSFGVNSIFSLILYSIYLISHMDQKNDIPSKYLITLRLIAKKLTLKRVGVWGGIC